VKILTYRLKFRKAVTFEQEKKLNAAVQWNILEDMREQLVSYKKKAPETVKAYIDSLLFETEGKPYFYRYFVLGKEDDRTYVFGGPDPAELLGISSIVNKIPSLPAILPRSRLYEKFLHNVVTAHMSVESGGYTITKIMS
jgi:hypothetical protein